MVIGEFDVRGVIYDQLPRLWDRTKGGAGIEKQFFFDYFCGRNHGYAIEIGNVRLYPSPMRLDEHFGLRPPQSFVYLSGRRRIPKPTEPSQKQ